MRALGQRLQDDGRGGGARGKSQGVFGVLEGGDGRLEVVAVGVGAARVLVGARGLADCGLGKGRRERELGRRVGLVSSDLRVCDAVARICSENSRWGR